MNFYI